MSITPGFTVAEIREFVHEYQLLPYGGRGAWLLQRDFSYDTMRKWCRTIFEGDLDRGLIPRDGSEMTIRPDRRTALEKLRAAERAAHAAEIARLSGRVRELEDTNTALGKAIGLLHAMSEEEPETPPTTPDESSS
jgi:hypothetical protein